MNSIFSKLWNKSFRTQLIYGFGFVLTLLIVTFTYISTKSQSNFLHEEGIKQAKNRVKALAVTSKVWMMSNDYVGLEEVISNFSVYEDLTFVAIMNLDGKIIGHTDKTLVGKFIADKERIEYLKEALKPGAVHNEEDKIFFHNDKHIDIMKIIDHENKYVGLVHIRIDQSSRQKNVDNIILQGISFTLVSVFIGIIFAFLVANGLTDQLSRLVMTMKKVIDGDKNAKANEDGVKEIAELSHEFNSLIKSLDSSEKLNQKLTQAVEQSPNTIVITNLEGNIEYVNKAFVTITGYEKEDALGKNPRLLQSGKTPRDRYDYMWAELTQGKNWQGEFINMRKDGTEYIEAVKASPIFHPDGTISHYMAIKEDITEHRYAEERIDYLINNDVLTGLPNRNTLKERISYAINLAHRQNNTLAVLFLNLDRFKDINDTLGHSVGDIVLMELSKQFSSVLREGDIVSRIGGDEFVIVLPNINAQSVAHVAQKLLDVTAQSLIIGKNEITETVSIGIALYPIDGTDEETLFKNADTAMYRAKQNGRNQYCFFTQEMQAHAARNLLLTNALRLALKKNQLEVVYQPQISLSNNIVLGAEALLRWKHPELGQISPVEFISLAEESGLILPIGEWVLRTAIKEAKHWIESGLPPMVVAVNISAVQFHHPDLPNLVTSILREVGLKEDYLELELTESVAMKNPESAYAIMDNLHGRGVRMSIDDFGTGYSSLSYLKKFKVYKLKIDKSFVDDLHTNPEDQAIASAIISMAHSLGLKTIAEGVETIEQLDYLRGQGCDEIQGYYYSKPLSTEAFEMFVKNQNKSYKSRTQLPILCQK